MESSVDDTGFQFASRRRERLRVLRLDASWQAIVRQISGDLDAAELIEANVLHVEPLTPSADVGFDQHLGEWSGILKGMHATVPPGGITARLLRKVKVNAHIREGRTILHRREMAAKKQGLRSGLREWLRTDGLKSIRPPSAPQKGGRPRNQALLDKIAGAYRAAVSSGSPSPVADVAVVLRINRKKVSNIVSVARSQGLLPKTSRGVIRA
jgi:hypothetical protein